MVKSFKTILKTVGACALAIGVTFAGHTTDLDVNGMSKVEGSKHIANSDPVWPDSDPGWPDNPSFANSDPIWPDSPEDPVWPDNDATVNSDPVWPDDEPQNV